MNAVFTIVAKNYLSLAMTLGDSIKQLHPELSFHIFLADEIDGMFDPLEVGFSITEIKDVGIEKLEDLAFKYNVTEFCTAVKPFCFNFLFEKFNYTKLIYFDPDIYVLNSLDDIFRNLENNFIVLTPHYVTPEINYSGSVPEGLILFVGVYNLGFLGLKRDSNGTRLLSWWENRLRDKSYADKIEGFHTDQKWMDFVPALFDDGVKISKNLGYNVSIWNLHERVIEFENGTFIVHHKENRLPRVPLTFFHFAGFNPSNLEIVHKNYPTVKTERFKNMVSLLQRYKNELEERRYDFFIKMNYKYNFFENGEQIIQFQRRLYKQMTKEGWIFENPFIRGNNSFYDLLEKNALLSKANMNVDRLNERGLSGFESKIKIINWASKLLKMILGFDRYALLTKFFLRYFRPENQVFLIKEVTSYHFVNENSANNN